VAAVPRSAAAARRASKRHRREVELVAVAQIERDAEPWPGPERDAIDLAIEVVQRAERVARGPLERDHHVAVPADRDRARARRHGVELAARGQVRHVGELVGAVPRVDLRLHAEQPHLRAGVPRRRAHAVERHGLAVTLGAEQHDVARRREEHRARGSERETRRSFLSDCVRGAAGVPHHAVRGDRDEPIVRHVDARGAYLRAELRRLLRRTSGLRREPGDVARLGHRDDLLRVDAHADDLAVEGDAPQGPFALAVVQQQLCAFRQREDASASLVREHARGVARSAPISSPRLTALR
jgi:hypothetical protein